MILRVPSYYRKFQCIADRCRDSCCIGWEIDIDEDTFSYYKSVGGPFGERLAAHMTEGEQNSFALRENGWCPFLNEKKLCDICTELGEEALCEVCTEYPRFTMEYGNVREKVLCLSCEEVGRILFSSDAKTTWEEQELEDWCMEPGEEDAGAEKVWETEEDAGTQEARKEEEDVWAEEAPGEEEDAGAEIEALEAVRQHAVEILQNRAKPVFVRAAEYLTYCEKMQGRIFGCGDADTQSSAMGRKQELPDDADAQEKAAPELPDDADTQSSATGRKPASPDDADAQEAASQAYGMFRARMECFAELETLDDTWENEKKQLLRTFSEENYLVSLREFVQTGRAREYEYEHLLVYFTFRYFMRACYDGNLLAKAQFAVAGVLMIRDMDVRRYLQSGRFSPEDRIETAKLYAKEVEHSEENMELLAEDFQFEEVFSVKNLIAALLGGVA